jgi:hypothetical protein
MQSSVCKPLASISALSGSVAILKIFYLNLELKNKYVFAFEKKYFDSLALGLYLSLLGPFLADSQIFNLVYK